MVDRAGHGNQGRVGGQRLNTNRILPFQTDGLLLQTDIRLFITHQSKASFWGESYTDGSSPEPKA